MKVSRLLFKVLPIAAEVINQALLVLDCDAYTILIRSDEGCQAQVARLLSADDTIAYYV